MRDGPNENRENRIEKNGRQEWRNGVEMKWYRRKEKISREELHRKTFVQNKERYTGIGWEKEINK